MDAPRPAMSQYQGPMYIKQLEDIFMPPQPFSMAEFPHQAREFKPLYPKLPSEFVPLQEINPDFLPFKVDYKRYIHNSKIGYHDDTPYPMYTTGFSNGYR